MKTTHRSLLPVNGEVIAWQFRHDIPLPDWVAKKFHKLDASGWLAYTTDGSVTKAEPSDWAVLVDNIIVVLTHEEFNTMFQSL